MNDALSDSCMFEYWLIAALFFGFPVDEVFLMVKTEDFENYELARVYDAIQKLASFGKPITIDYLLSQGMDLAFLLKIRDGVSSPANCLYYAEQVSDSAKKRRLKVDCQETSKKIIQGTVETAEEISMVLLNKIDENLQSAYIKQPAFNETFAEWIKYCRANSEEGPVLFSGLHKLDGIMSPLNGGRLVILGARTGIGKTALAIQIMVQSAQRQKKVAYFSLEIEKKNLLQIISANRFGINRTRLAKNDISELSQHPFENFAQSMSDKIFLYDDKRTFTSICSEIRLMKRRNHIDFAVIDYIGLVNAQQKPFETTVDYHTRMSKDLKALSLQLQIPIIVVAQLNRECVKNNRKPILSDIKDSGSFEQDADMVILLHRADKDESKEHYFSDTEILILKSRVGSINSAGVYGFNGRTQQFLDNSPVVTMQEYREKSRGGFY